MTQQATVVLVEGKKMAQVIRSEACAQCRACAHGQTERQLIPIPEGLDVRPGDRVELVFPEGGVGKAALLCYGVPFLGFALGLGLGALAASRFAWPQDLCCALGAVLLTALSWLIVRRADRALKRRGCLDICVHVSSAR